MKYLKLISLLLAATVMAFSASSFAKDKEWPEVTEDGLHRVHDAKMAAVYAEPGASLSPYSRIMLLEPEVAFDKKWKRNLRSGSANQLSASNVNTTKIKKQLAEEFMVVFTNKLTESGYELTDEAADDV